MDFVISDMHFDHTNIIKYDNRPFTDVQQMNDKMVDNWNGVVRPKDKVYHIGDFAMGFNKAHVLHYLGLLNGTIVFIRGNHDGILDKILPGELLDVKMVKYNKRKFWLSHYQHAVWPDQHRGAIHIFGHSHGRQDFEFLKAFDACANSNNYTPVSLDKVAEVIDARCALLAVKNASNDKRNQTGG